MKIHLRPAMAADVDVTYAIKQDALKIYIEQVWGWDEAYQKQLHSNGFEPHFILIIQADGVPVGYIELEENKDFLFIANILIIKAYQNKRIGTILLQNMIQKAKEQQQEVCLEVLKVNEKARKLYERLGFEVYEEDGVKFKMSYK